MFCILIRVGIISIAKTNSVNKYLNIKHILWTRQCSRHWGCSKIHALIELKIKLEKYKN